MAERVTLHGPQQMLDGMQEPTPTVMEPTPGSIVARLRAQGQAQLRAKTTEVPVGGEFTGLYIRYKVLAPGEMDKFVAARMGAKAQDISATAATMDMMARACVCLVGRYGDEEEVLADDDGPVRLEDRLAYLLDMRSPTEPRLTSHDVIERLFGHNGAMIAMHGDVLATWMQDPGSQEDERPVGEE
jgi:hypothetical protein